MNTPQTLQLQYALVCLSALDQYPRAPLSAENISREKGIPFPNCVEVLERLSFAGLIEELEGRRYRLPQPASELRALDVWQAVYAVLSRPPAFKLMTGEGRLALTATLNAARQAAHEDAYPSENGRA
jgi:DNA-binding IscR family transcriptional regulator